MDFTGLTNEHMIYGTLFALSNRLQTYLDRMLPEITSKQHFLLIVLSLFKDTNPSLKEVASAMGCSYQNVKRMADCLEKKGYLIIKRDAVDKRKYSLIMTDKIIEFSEKTDEESDKFMQDLYRGLSQEDLQNTLNMLTKMEHNLKQRTSSKGK